MHGHHFQKELLHDLSTSWQEADQPAVPPSTLLVLEHQMSAFSQSSEISSDVFSEKDILTTLTNLKLNALSFLYLLQYSLLYLYCSCVFKVRDLHTMFFNQTMYTFLQGVLYINCKNSTSRQKKSTIPFFTIYSFF